VSTPVDQQVGVLYLRQGDIIHASIEDLPELRPEKVLMRMMLWERGAFDLLPEGDPPPTEMNFPLERMLIETARQQDELAELAKAHHLPARNTAVSLVHPAPLRWHQLANDELDVLQDLVQCGSWAGLMDSSAQDDIDLYRHIVALKDKGIVEYE
jgi:hypothetical protein